MSTQLAARNDFSASRRPARSLRGRLAFLFALVCAATIATAALMFALFQQSAAAQGGQAAAELARACEEIGDRFNARLGNRGLIDPTAPFGEATTRELTGLVTAALAHRPGVEGGVRAQSVSLAYAYPTYLGSGPKTDEPVAELATITSVNAAARAQNGLAMRRIDAPTQLLLVDACPLSPSAPDLTAWVMTRIATFAGPKYQLLMAGFLLLLATLVGAAALLAQIVAIVNRRVAAIETTLGAANVESVPELQPTGERELDRIVDAVNELRQRLAVSRAQTEAVRAQLVAGERLAALGRVAAGVAHEIRNPIAAMRLRAETALAGGPERREAALRKVIEQVDRIDGIVSRLLRGTMAARPACARVEIAPFLQRCVEDCAEAAGARQVILESAAAIDFGEFDPKQMRDAIVNLIENAVAAAPTGSTVRINACSEGDRLTFSVADCGEGLPPSVRENLFEPFFTTRPDALGLGLAVVREIARAHRGAARVARDDETGVTFEIALPCARF